MAKDSLESIIGTLDVWLIVFALIVAVGVAGEFILGWVSWHKHRALKVIERAEEQRLQLKIEGFRSNNLELQKEVLDLKIKQMPRTISKEEREKFITFLKDAPKGNIRIMVPENLTTETRDFALAIYKIIVAAGYLVPNKIENDSPSIPRFTAGISIAINIHNMSDSPPYADWIHRAATNLNQSVWFGPTESVAAADGLKVQPGEILIYVAEKPVVPIDTSGNSAPNPN